MPTRGTAFAKLGIQDTDSSNRAPDFRPLLAFRRNSMRSYFTRGVLIGRSLSRLAKLPWFRAATSPESLLHQPSRPTRSSCSLNWMAFIFSQPIYGACLDRSSSLTSITCSTSRAIDLSSGAGSPNEGVGRKSKCPVGFRLLRRTEASLCSIPGRKSRFCSEPLRGHPHSAS